MNTSFLLPGRSFVRMRSCVILHTVTRRCYSSMPASSTSSASEAAGAQATPCPAGSIRFGRSLAMMLEQIQARLAKLQEAAKQKDAVKTLKKATTPTQKKERKMDKTTTPAHGCGCKDGRREGSLEAVRRAADASGEEGVAIDQGCPSRRGSRRHQAPLRPLCLVEICLTPREDQSASSVREAVVTHALSAADRLRANATSSSAG